MHRRILSEKREVQRYPNNFFFSGFICTHISFQITIFYSLSKNERSMSEEGVGTFLTGLKITSFRYAEPVQQKILKKEEEAPFSVTNELYTSNQRSDYDAGIKGYKKSFRRKGAEERDRCDSGHTTRFVSRYWLLDLLQHSNNNESRVYA